MNKTQFYKFNKFHFFDLSEKFVDEQQNHNALLEKIIILKTLICTNMISTRRKLMAVYIVLNLDNIICGKKISVWVCHCVEGKYNM